MADFSKTNILLNAQALAFVKEIKSSQLADRYNSLASKFHEAPFKLMLNDLGRSHFFTKFKDKSQHLTLKELLGLLAEEIQRRTNTKLNDFHDLVPCTKLGFNKLLDELRKMICLAGQVPLGEISKGFWYYTSPKSMFLSVDDFPYLCKENFADCVWSKEFSMLVMRTDNHSSILDHIVDLSDCVDFEDSLLEEKGRYLRANPLENTRIISAIFYKEQDRDYHCSMKNYELPYKFKKA